MASTHISPTSTALNGGTRRAPLRLVSSDQPPDPPDTVSALNELAADLDALISAGLIRVVIEDGCVRYSLAGEAESATGWPLRLLESDDLHALGIRRADLTGGEL